MSWHVMPSYQVTELPKLPKVNSKYRMELAVSRLRLNDHRVSIWASLGVFLRAVVVAAVVVVSIDSRTPFFTESISRRI